MSTIRNPVEVSMIWAAMDDGEVVWLVDAWDEYSIDGHYDGWLAAIAKAKSENEDIRILTTTLDYEAVEKAFKVAHVESTNIETTTNEGSN